MFQNIGIPGLILILILALIIFGPQKLPLLGRAVGQTFREFRKTANDISEDVSVTENHETKTIQVDEFKSR